MASIFTHSVRNLELDQIMPILPADCALLEIGAGDGWQAKQLEPCCKSVDAIDIPDDGRNPVMHYPVTSYDGRNIPFSDSYFDVVYTSNVLEHVKDFSQLNQEIHRVLKPGGLAIHCLPSATWRIWTSIGHPIYVLRWACRFAAKGFDSKEISPSNREVIAKTSRWKLLLKALFSPRHGERGTMISEIWLFSRPCWKSLFENSGWKIVDCQPSGIFYTGNEIFGFRISTKLRRQMSKILGSSTNTFVLKK